MILTLLRLAANIIPIIMGLCFFGISYSVFKDAFTKAEDISMFCADIILGSLEFVLGLALFSLGIINVIYSIALL